MNQKKFRPSNSERFLNCNLSIWLPEDEKTKEQEAYLDERSKDHERLARGEFLKHEVNCKAYYDYILEKCDEIFVEEPLSSFISGEVFEGTPDLFGYDIKTKTLYIIDYKTGFYPVSAFGNSQLLSYAALILLIYLHLDIDNFKLSILNTQKDQLSHFEPEKETILKHIARLNQSLRFRREGTAYAVTGEWCRFCPSKNYCPLQRDIKETKELMDIHTDELIYAKEMRASEVKKRTRELRENEDASKVFEYRIVGPQKKLKVLKNE